MNKIKTSDIYNAKKVNSGTNNVNSKEIADLYANINSQSYLEESKNKNMANINSLIRSKYGANASLENGFNMSEQQGLNTMWKPEEISLYNKYLSELTNANQSLAQLGTLDINRNQSLAQQDVLARQAQKYTPEMLGAGGLSGVGTSESTLAGIRNAYASNVGNINNQYMASQQDILNNYNANQLQNLNDFNQQQYNTQLQNREDISNLIINTNSIDNLENIMKLYSNSGGIDNYVKSLYEEKKQELNYNNISNELYTKLENNSSNEDIQNYLDSNKDLLTKTDYNQLNSLVKEYQNTNYGSGISSSDLLTIKTNFSGSDKKDSKQNELIKKISKLMEQGYFTNGDKVDLNYGIGSSVYEFRDGKLYKASNNKITSKDKGANSQVMNAVG